MRYDSEHKQQTRARVLEVAARAIRAEGPDRVGVAGVMAEAGLTHGGFYAHFRSKDELVAAAIGRMFDEARERASREMDGREPAEALAAYIDFYLSRRHRDARGAGCPMAALAADAPRLPEAARADFAEGADRIVQTFARQLKALGRDGAEALARSAVAELVGALSLARIEADAKRSDAILAASKRQLKQRLGLEASA